ncbi:heat shock factor protein 3-like isoform X2 [Lacerta agilis]|nr:heat shock factor protein 3-like isoform X2 [Lacerta agilis]XP_032993987.1 heat shock factor protein 3-like isoform X2 [Lacerta agilis]
MSIRNGTMAAVNNSPMEFQHPHFMQRKPELLANIQRKVPTPKEPTASSRDLQAMLSELQAMREQQNNISIKLDAMARGNTSLKKGIASLQQNDNQQKHVLSQILQFIVNWMSEKGREDAQRKRRQNDASEAPPPKDSRPQAHSAMENRETAAVPGPSADRKDLIVTRNNMGGEAGGAVGANSGQAVVHERRGTREAQVPATGDTSANKGPQTVDTPRQTTAAQIGAMKLLSAFAAYVNGKKAQSSSSPDRKKMQDFLNFFSANTVELGALLSEKFNCISEIVTETFVPELQDLDVDSAGALDCSLENLLFQDVLGFANWSDAAAASTSNISSMNEQEAPRRNDLFQNQVNPLLGEPPTFKMEDGSNVPLGASLENRPPVLFSGEALEEFLDPGYQADGVPTLLLLDQPLFFGNVYGDY